MARLPRNDTQALDDIERLPYVDEHSVSIAGEDPALLWSALGEAIERLWRVPSLAARLWRAQPVTRHGDPLKAGSTLPGFAVVRARPGEELALQGHHRFSAYALVFRLAEDGERTTLTAQTRAAFPGVNGRAYRVLVVGTRVHALLLRGLLDATRRGAERRRSPKTTSDRAR